VNRKKLDDGGWSLANKVGQALLDKIRKTGVPLGEYVKGAIYYGIKTGLNEAFVIDAETKKRIIEKDAKSKELIKPFLAGRDIKRYQEPTSDKYLIFTRRGVDIGKYPAIYDHLMQFKEQLKPKPKGWKGKKWKGRKTGSYKWYEIQDAVDYYEEFEKPKIIIPAIVKAGSYLLDENKFYSNDKTSIIPIRDLYLLGLLNSKTLDYVIHSISSTKQGGYYEYKPMYLHQLPIRIIDVQRKSEKSCHDKMISLVNSILALNKKLAEANTEHDRNVLQRQIAATDGQIDRLVYELYGLTEEEMAIVENSTKS
jgi:NOL1/NOP2/fmu family ribosome biogenesis protein